MDQTGANSKWAELEINMRLRKYGICEGYRIKWPSIRQVEYLDNSKQHQPSSKNAHSATDDTVFGLYHCQCGMVSQEMKKTIPLFQSCVPVSFIYLLLHENFYSSFW